MRSLLLLFPLLLPAQTRDGAILERSDCKLNEPDDPRFVCEKLTYSSDQLPVIAYLYSPANVSGRLPVVVFNRGSYIVKNQLPNLLGMFKRLAEAGFAVVAPMYRGSDGSPGRDEMGGADLHDLMNVVPLVRNLTVADADNLFLYGVSRGGIMCLLAVRDGFPARAAATIGAITDLAAYFKEDPGASRMAKMIWPDYESRREEIHLSRSALQWSEKVKKPILLMHGGADPQVDPLHTLKLATRLQELGHPYGVTILAGGDHNLNKFGVERDRQAIEWFRRHLR